MSNNDISNDLAEVEKDLLKGKSSLIAQQGVRGVFGKEATVTHKTNPEPNLDEKQVLSQLDHTGKCLKGE